MFRVSQGVGQREKDIGVEELQRVGQGGVSIPGYDPGIEQGIANIARHSIGRVQPQWMGYYQSQQGVEQENHERV
jgi:hypothetical protein